MKRKLWLAGVLVLCVLILLLSGGRRDAAWYEGYVKKHGALLEQIAAGEADPDASLRARYVMRRGGVTSVYADDSSARFYLEGAPVEGHLMLALSPAQEYTPACLGDYDNWVQVQDQAGFGRWEGGMAGKGYVELHDLGGGFYLEEAYLPT